MRASSGSGGERDDNAGRGQVTLPPEKDARTVYNVSFIIIATVERRSRRSRSCRGGGGYRKWGKHSPAKTRVQWASRRGFKRRQGGRKHQVFDSKETHSVSFTHSLTWNWKRRGKEVTMGITSEGEERLKGQGQERIGSEDEGEILGATGDMRGNSDVLLTLPANGFLGRGHWHWHWACVASTGP